MSLCTVVVPLSHYLEENQMYELATLFPKPILASVFFALLFALLFAAGARYELSKGEKPSPGVVVFTLIAGAVLTYGVYRWVGVMGT